MGNPKTLDLKEMRKIIPDISDIQTRYSDDYPVTKEQLELFRAILDKQPTPMLKSLIEKASNSSNGKVFFLVNRDVLNEALGIKTGRVDNPLSAALSTKKIDIIKLVLDHLFAQKNELQHTKEPDALYEVEGSTIGMRNGDIFNGIILNAMFNAILKALYRNEDVEYGASLMNCLVDTMNRHGISKEDAQKSLTGFFAIWPKQPVELERQGDVEYDPLMVEVENKCNSLLSQRFSTLAEIRKNARVLSQGKRDPNSLFSSLPDEIATKIAAHTRGKEMSQEDAEEVARKNYDRPPTKK